MAYGFRIYNQAGQLTLSSSNFGFTMLDKIEVSPYSTSSRSYSGVSDLVIHVAQTQKEPTAASVDEILAFNVMNTSVSLSGADVIVSWSPRIVSGIARNVILYVMVMA